MALELNEQERQAAEEFISALLTENIEEGQFSEGTALRDLVVKSLSFIFAALRKENRQVQSLQNLRDAVTLANTDPNLDRAVANAVDGILSNWFINRKTGSFARGTLYVEVSRKQDYIIPVNNRFQYDRGRSFFIDTEDTDAGNIVIPASSVFPNVSSDGNIQNYTFSVRVVAARTGDNYNVSPSTWVSAGGFSPFIISTFNDERFGGGRNRETTEEVIDRAESAISTRNLINTKSIDATLRSRFSDLSRLLTVGMAEPEMRRDIRTNIILGQDLHLGGHFDIYCELPISQRTFEGQVGGRFPRPDNISNILRDDNVSDWTAEDVVAGDIIRIATGLPDAPRDFTIKEVFSHELRISEHVPFSKASEDDEEFVTYFIYRPVFGPDTQIYPSSGVSDTGVTSRFMQTPNTVLLPGGAHYDIVDVAILNPEGDDDFIDSSDDFVHFGTRINSEPEAAILAEDLVYQVVNTRPETAQSSLSLEELKIEEKYEGKTLRVVYDTLVGLNTVHDFVTDRFERVLSANVLARGFFPVYLSFEIPYKLRTTATSSIDETALKRELVKYINDFDPREIIDVSDVVNQVRNFSNQIGAVFDFTIFYDLIAPDGRIINYETDDEVIVTSDKLTEDSDELQNPIEQSLSERTIRYITTEDRITVVRNG